MLSCRGVTRKPWFERRDLEVEPGEVVVLRGPTGSGKSLFLRAVADLDPSEFESISLGGRNRGSFRPEEWRRRVLYVHQSAPRLPGTVAQNLANIAELLQRDGDEFDLLGLDPRADAERLSGGEAQLLALARALLVDPDVLLLDEATSALDPDRARRSEGLLLARLDRGRSIVWVSHDSGLAERLGAREEPFP